MTTKPPPWQRLEDLACAYWQSETLFAALRLGLFAPLARPRASADLAAAAQCRKEELAPLLAALESLGLLIRDHDGRWRLHPEAAPYLDPKSPAYLGDFLLYRHYLKSNWQDAASRIAARPLPPPLGADAPYEVRNLHYVRAMDAWARLKAGEISAIMATRPWQPPILDIGGGAGAVSRALVADNGGRAVLVELPEVLAAAHRLYPEDRHWRDIECRAADFRSCSFEKNERFGLVILGNFLHIYDQDEAAGLLAKACALTTTNGMLLIHDYFPDQPRARQKGRLYDLNMMLNTLKGRCHPIDDLLALLRDLGRSGEAVPLDSDSCLIISPAAP